MYNVLIVDDDDFLRAAFKKKLETEGYGVLEAVDRASVLAQLKACPDVHLILLDIILNKDNGIETISEIRERTQAPIIMVSSKDHLVDKVAALEMGADDYMSKPVEAKEMLSRIKAHIRRYSDSQGRGSSAAAKETGSFKIGSWHVDPKNYSVRHTSGKDAGLTKDEFDLLVTLANKPNVIFTREKLFEILKPGNYETFDRAIDIQIARIRRKLGDNARSPRIIKTVRKVGYTFVGKKSEAQ